LGDSAEGNFSDKRGSEMKGALFIKQARQANMRAQAVLTVCLHRGKFTATVCVEAVHVASNENEKAKKSRSPMLRDYGWCPNLSYVCS
jgi:hypothetical protein